MKPAARFKKEGSKLSGPADFLISKSLRALGTFETVLGLKLKEQFIPERSSEPVMKKSLWIILRELFKEPEAIKC